MPTSSRKKVKEAATSESIQVEMLSPSTPMIFISHDTRDAELAEYFSKLLSSVSAGVLKSFRSSDKKGSQGIEYGVEWYPELMKKLTSASDVVCLLTQRSLDRPWLLYEAGVARGKLNTPVYGIALGIPLHRANTGPFAQFQNSDDSIEALTKVVMQLVGRIPNAEPDRDAIEMQVKTFKNKASDLLKKLDVDNLEEEDEATVDEASVAKLFEEVKVMFQDLPSRLEGRVTHARRSRRAIDPGVIDELLYMARKLGDPIGLLILMSYYRDEIPWLYEIGMEAYRAIKSGNQNDIADAVRMVHKAVDFAMHTPLAGDFRSKENYLLTMELPRILEGYLLEVAPKPKKVSSKKLMPETVEE